ncbi:MAG: hypothetical protein WA139_04030 [Candidatus Aenigmatarchaeota archaeon]
MDTGLEDLFPVLGIIAFFAVILILFGYLLGWFDWLPNILAVLSRKVIRL